jgi:uncharacterized protein (TIGR00251 family)
MSPLARGGEVLVRSQRVSMIELREVPGGVILPVQAHPGARRNGVTGIHDGRLKVAVTTPPEKGKANQALIEVLAGVLDLRRSQISLLSGEASRTKAFLLSGIDGDTVRRRLRESLK